jgi:uncharacterized membrane protein YjjP (DUF1212 family)
MLMNNIFALSFTAAFFLFLLTGSWVVGLVSLIGLYLSGVGIVAVEQYLENKK